MQEFRPLAKALAVTHPALHSDSPSYSGTKLITPRMFERRARLASCAADRSTPTVNPFAIGWFWRGLKGNSVTFAAMFALFVLGWSVSSGLNHLLVRLGVHWLYALVLPAVFFWWLAKQEERIIPDAAKRRLVARSLIIGSMGAALLMAWLH